MKRLPIVILFCSFLGFIFFTSCIDDNFPISSSSERRVYFKADIPSGSDVSLSDITRITLLAFDTSGYYVGEWNKDFPDLSTDFSIPVDLEPGRYRFIAYGSLSSPYELVPAERLPGETTMMSARMQISLRSDGAVTSALTPLFYGSVADAEVMASSQKQQLELTLREVTNRIRVTAEGLRGKAGDYRIRIDDTNGDYTLLNDFLNTRKLFYTALCKPAEKTCPDCFSAFLTVLRLSDKQRSGILSFREERTNRILYQTNLVELLQQSGPSGGHVDFDRIHDFDIHLRFSADLLVAVTVNGWLVTSQEGGL